MYANNKLSARNFFVARRHYEQAYPKDFSIYEIPLDMWTDRLLYSNYIKNSLIFLPKKTKLKRVDGILLLDFVADAYLELQQNLKLLAKSGKTCISTILDNYTATKGYENYHLFYEENAKSFRDIFIPWINKQKILTFNEMLKELNIFADTYCTTNQITFNSFFTKRNSHYTSGLSFDFGRFQHDNDFDKIQTFIENPSFDDYTRICGQSGFFTNKNAPWNLVANLDSEQMKKHMLKYGISDVNIFFSEYATQDVLKYSFEKFKELIKYTWLEACRQKPFITTFMCNEDPSRKRNNRIIVDDKTLFELYIKIIKVEYNQENVTNVETNVKAWELVVLDSIARDLRHLERGP